MRFSEARNIRKKETSIVLNISSEYWISRGLMMLIGFLEFDDCPLGVFRSLFRFGDIAKRNSHLAVIDAPEGFVVNLLK